jgi:electron-transferring-flavoprotein dehydrogenase
VRKFFEGGECVSYGARVLNEGGYHAIPKLSFPGGMLAGCSAGFLNVSKIKGTHNAMKTGMVAAETIMEKIGADGLDSIEATELSNYQANVDDTWVLPGLKKSRNFQPGFKKGLWFGLAHGGLLMHLTKGREPWTLAVTAEDSTKTEPASKHQEIKYPKHDGVLTFDLLTNL